MRVQPLGQEDALEKEMATHSSILAWEIPWIEEPGGLQSMGLQRVNSKTHFSSLTCLIYSLKLLTSIFFIKSWSLGDFTSFFPIRFTKFNSFNELLDDLAM